MFKIMLPNRTRVQRTDSVCVCVRYPISFEAVAEAAAKMEKRLMS